MFRVVGLLLSRIFIIKLQYPGEKRVQIAEACAEAGQAVGACAKNSTTIITARGRVAKV